MIYQNRNSWCRIEEDQTQHRSISVLPQILGFDERKTLLGKYNDLLIDRSILILMDCLLKTTGDRMIQ